ncbi:MAG TPA: DUF4845 domain-containing protein [Candidatus Angelobacter sp.]|jgi:hypothetical protein|nr:DUF4845 domain-containing protein [Candidatus Angelobacter sp.]
MGKVKGFFGLAVIVAGFYVAWNLIPPYFHNYQLQDDLDDIARKMSYLGRNDDEIKASVISKAKNSDIALKEDQVLVTRDGDGLSIAVKYRVHVDMMVHPVDIDFAAKSFNKRI